MIIVSLIIFIAGSITHLYVKWLDIKSSREFTALGIKERNKLFQDKNGYFSEPKAWFAVGLFTAVALGVYVLFVFVSYIPAFAVLVYIPSAAMSLSHWTRNKKVIKNFKEKQGIYLKSNGQT